MFECLSYCFKVIFPYLNAYKLTEASFWNNTNVVLVSNISWKRFKHSFNGFTIGNTTYETQWFKQFPSAHSHLGWQTVVQAPVLVPQSSPWQHFVSSHDPQSFHCSLSPHSGLGHSSRHHEWPVFGSKKIITHLSNGPIRFKDLEGLNWLTSVSCEMWFTSTDIWDRAWAKVISSGHSCAV